MLEASPHRRARHQPGGLAVAAQVRGEAVSTSNRHRRRLAKAWYMPSRSPANRLASSPPAAPLISMMTLRSSLGSRGTSRPLALRSASRPPLRGSSNWRSSARSGPSASASIRRASSRSSAAARSRRPAATISVSCLNGGPARPGAAGRTAQPGRRDGSPPRPAPLQARQSAPAPTRGYRAPRKHWGRPGCGAWDIDVIRVRIARAFMAPVRRSAPPTLRRLADSHNRLR